MLNNSVIILVILGIFIILKYLLESHQQYARHSLQILYYKAIALASYSFYNPIGNKLITNCVQS